MRRPNLPDPGQALNARSYRRGAVLGLTVAEAFMLLAFILLMLMMLWRAESEEELREAVRATAGGPEQIELIVKTMDDLQVAGLSPTDPLLQEKVRMLVALSSDQTGTEILRRIEALSPEARRQLVELVASGRVDELVALKDTIRGQILGEEARREALGQAIADRLGVIVAEVGGRIEPDGSIVLPDTVLFDAGSSEITARLLEFLESACGPWIDALRSAGLDVSDLRIEGHASSEWDASTPTEVAYLYNLELSQRRAQAVLGACLDLAGADLGAWARDRATAIGYSSSRPVLVDGVEDATRSRRVVFNATLSHDALLDTIGQAVEGDASAGAAVRSARSPESSLSEPTSAESSEATALGNDAARDDVSPSVLESPVQPSLVVSSEILSNSGASATTPPLSNGSVAESPSAGSASVAGTASVIDGDTIEIRGQRIRLFGIDAPETYQRCADQAGAIIRCGQRASLALSDRIGRAPVVCEARGRSYDRILAICRQDGVDLGAWMVEGGLAYADSRFTSDYDVLEAAARGSGAGFWAGEFEAPWNVRDGESQFRNQ